jgi:hypothetical protein
VPILYFLFFYIITSHIGVFVYPMPRRSFSPTRIHRPLHSLLLDARPGGGGGGAQAPVLPHLLLPRAAPLARNTGALSGHSTGDNTSRGQHRPHHRSTWRRGLHDQSTRRQIYIGRHGRRSAHGDLELDAQADAGAAAPSLSSDAAPLGVEAAMEEDTTRPSLGQQHQRA